MNWHSGKMAARTHFTQATQGVLSTVLILLSALFCITAFAQDSLVATHYTDTQKRDMGFEIARELRCPMAVNQNLFDSQSKIASELKGQIFLMLDEGQSKAAIIDFMVVRYGEKIRYMPALSSHTFMLWLIPIILVLLAIVGLFFFVQPTLKAQKLEQDTLHE
ncbi:cytochrome c-type biogenesis protein CcmH [Shewanella abyssi]|uniref:cytochrome c-type biogenesis protein n=1 Tax=Shewanella abyssi TaxID=311789 RepID=UPI00200FF531|nr:cytochrome c-type biogenesis protein [Shewanella abyssi]MCL1049725.1 cytochrome c-type biogenesis protein CcmH [Shewanella abyssi]